MKNIISNCVLTVFVIFGMVSCKLFSEPESRYHYYAFNDNDNKWLLNGFKGGDKVVYVNDKKEKAIFQVKLAEIGLRSDYTRGLFSNKYFEYDRQDVRLNCISTPYLGEINVIIRKFPVDASVYEMSQTTVKDKLPEQLSVQIQIPKWNYVDYRSILGDAFIKGNVCCSTPMVINNKTYNQVFTILSGNNQPYTPCTTGCWTYDVNKMLYDKEKGVIGWENIAGEKWMLE